MKPSEILKIEDLLLDESFIAYCKNNSGYEKIKWEKFAAQSDEHTQLLTTAKTYYNELFSLMAASDLHERELQLKSKLLLSTSNHLSKNSFVFSQKAIILKIAKWAVACAIAIILYLVINPKDNPQQPPKNYTSELGERKNLQLPDGSIVTLNAGSHINIPENFGKISRDIFLEGEAFFDVKHNPKIPFIVHTASMDIKALGTAFNVKAYPEDQTTETDLIRGLVEVTLKHDHFRKLKLHPNEKIVYRKRMDATLSEIKENKRSANLNDSVSLVFPLNIQSSSGQIKEVAWMENQLVFEDETFEEIAKKLERWYNVKIIFKNEGIKHHRYTGLFEKEELKMILEVLKESQEFNYEIKNGDKIKTVELFK